MAGPDAALEWLRSTRHQHAAIHLDVDVTTEFNVTDRLTPDAVATLLRAVDAEFHIVGLGVAEYVPHGALTLERLLTQFPILQ